MSKKAGIPIILTLFVAGMVALTGCGSGTSAPKDSAAPQQAAKPKEEDKTPVTLKFAVHLPINDEFKRLYIDPVTKKYPYITLELYKATNFKAYEELIASGDTPDLYNSFNGNMPGLKDRAMNMDMKPIFKEYNVDLNRFEQNYLDDIQYSATEKGELYGLPIETGFHALFYNKDIFDKFGVPYPKDGMTMDDTVELAKKVTRMDNGVQYRGWDTGGFVRLGQPLGLEYIDKKTGKAYTSTAGWKVPFELARQIYSIPGNALDKASAKNSTTGFMKERNIAMLNQTNIFSQLKEEEQKNGLKWDVAQYPSYKEKPNTYGNSTVYMVGMVPTTKYKEQVVHVIEAMTSDEVQTEVSKVGRISPLKSEAVKKAYGQGDDILKTKNVAGILKSKPVKYPIYLYREVAEPLTDNKFEEFVKGSEDVNTALRELDDQINKALADGGYDTTPKK
jgi:multiple sugar transport system substrate-binding protein